MNDEEGDVNTKLIKSSDDIGPGRIVYFRADGLKFLNELANFRRWVEEKEVSWNRQKCQTVHRESNYHHQRRNSDIGWGKC